MTSHVSLRALALALGLAAAALDAPGLHAQVLNATASGGPMMTRAELTKLLQRYQEAVASPAYSSGVKAQFRADARRVRERLQQGDFHPGDRVTLSVQGQPQIPDTVPVESGPKITLPVFGDISLKGVLRSELTARLTEALSRMIRNPVVHARALMRISVQGAVARPGYYVVPTDILVSDVLMDAGGPSPTADVNKTKIQRGATELYGGKQLQNDMREGLTLDQLGLQAGDEIVVPAKGNSIWGPVLRYGVVIATFLVLGIRIGGL